MIYIAVQLIQIFSAGGRVHGRTEVVQEVLTDLKTDSDTYEWSIYWA